MWEAKPGETPLPDLSGLKLRIVNPTRLQIEQFEGSNIALAQEKYFGGRLIRRMAPFNLPWVKKLHREMFGDVWEWAGDFRKTSKNMGVEANQIQMQILQLLDDLHSWPDLPMDWLEQGVRLHHRAVSIHPFENGNGRWSRMLCNIWLRLGRQPVVAWPVTLDRESPVLDRYLEALRAADQMDYEPLVKLHANYTEV